jgi:phosphonate transport system substrate-binding protein
VWRKDLDPAVKVKLYTFLMGYGRVGTDDETKTAKHVLSDLVWSPFHPSSDNQLLPIRLLEANKTLMKIQSDEKLSADEKASQTAAVRAEIAKIEATQKKADADTFQQRLAAFLDADKAGNQEQLKKMIAEFAAGTLTTH